MSAAGVAGDRNAGNETENLPDNPYNYSMPYLETSWQVRPGPYQPGFKFYGNGAVRIGNWIKNLGASNPLPGLINQPMLAGGRKKTKRRRKKRKKRKKTIKKRKRKK